MKSKRTLIHLELIRIIAAFFVIFNHTNSNGFFLFSLYPINSWQYVIYLFFSVLCKISVPLFFMVSGALLLKKDITLKDLWFNKIPRIVIVVFLFSIIHYVWRHIHNPNYLNSIPDFIRRFYMGQVNYAYWYLYAYIGFLIAFPFLRAVVKVISRQHYYYLILLAIIMLGILPCFEYRFSKNEVSLSEDLRNGWLFTNIVLWPLLGYFLENVLDITKINRKLLFFLLSLSIVGIGISSYMIRYQQLITGSCKEGETAVFHSAFVIFPCMFVYLASKYFFYHHSISTYVQKLIQSFGDATFGIYLIHVMLKTSKYAQNLWTLLLGKKSLHTMTDAFIFCLIIMGIGYLLVQLLKLIPGMKKLI